MYRGGVTVPIVLVSNRGPLSFALDDGRLTARRGAGGLVSGLAPLVAGTDAIWIAAALTDADRTAAATGIVEAEGLRVRTPAIDPDVLRQSYDVICNATLWFAHHGMFDLTRRPVIDQRWHDAWDAYRRFNSEMAAAAAHDAPAGAVVLMQDYHLALAGPMLRRLRPDVTVVHFSHTPFAPPIMLRALPRTAVRELLEAMAGNHACGFHSERWAADFRASCAEFIGRTPVPFVAPLGPDAADLRSTASSGACADALDALDDVVGGRRCIVRVDRVEPAKNLVRGFKAFDLLLEKRPDLLGRVVFCAFGYPSRQGLPEYLAYRAEVESSAAVVNARHATSDWTPVRLFVDDDFPRSVAALRRYDVLLVNPIRDGLNLVAVEGPLVNERDGQVVASREAGIWDRLDGAAIGVNPYDIADQAEALAQALDMDRGQRTERAAELRRIAGARTPADWLADQLAAAAAAG